MTNGSFPLGVAIGTIRTMPVELIAFTADRRIHGAIPLADDRVSDMLNSVARIVIRRAVVEDLVGGTPAETSDVTLAVGSIFALLVAGPRGLDARRRRTTVHRARIGLTRFVVSGSLHVPAGSESRLASADPSIVLAGRDVLVALTDATISYDRNDEPTSEEFETILVNRAHATWIDLDGAAGGDDSEFVGRSQLYHAAIVPDLSRTR
jgi:hypothetical protein